MNVIETLKRAQSKSVPLVAIVTPDPHATIVSVMSGVNGETRYVSWDIVRGLHEPSDQPTARFGIPAQMVGTNDVTRGNPTALMSICLDKLPPDVMCFVHLADRYYKQAGIDGAMVIQGIKNLRDPLKGRPAMMVLLVSDPTMPAELKNDIYVIDEPLPDRERLRTVCQALVKQSKVGSAEFECDAADLDRSTSILEGLPVFPAEQSFAMSTRKKGVNFDDLSHRQRKMIEQTPGLSVYAGPETFADIGGVQNAKKFLKHVIGGKRKIRAFIFVDEIEKSMGGSEHDTSGVGQDQLRGTLTHMQDRKARGMMLVGVAGSAKSALAKAAGREASCPTIVLDLGGLKGSLVGQSEQQLRDALKVIDAVGGEDAVWIATCNRIASLPPELRRRFTLGTFFFDLPSAEDRNAIWDIYLKKHQIPKAQAARPADEQWTGAEIKQCVENAWDFGISLKDAARYVTPIAVSAADEIARLRQAASGRFISASYEGLYDMNAQPVSKKERAMKFE